MYSKFRVYLFKSISNTTLSQFLKLLNSKVNTFYNITRDELDTRSTYQQLKNLKDK